MSRFTGHGDDTHEARTEDDTFEVISLGIPFVDSPDHEPAHHPYGIVTGDFDGDGHNDLLVINHGADTWVEYLATRSVFEGAPDQPGGHYKLRRVTDGFGAITSIHYEHAVTTSSMFAPVDAFNPYPTYQHRIDVDTDWEPRCGWPLRCLTRAGNVVRMVLTSTGAAAAPLRTTRYYYRLRKQDRLTGNDLGFERIVAVQGFSSGEADISVSIFDNDTPESGGVSYPFALQPTAAWRIQQDPSGRLFVSATEHELATTIDGSVYALATTRRLWDVPFAGDINALWFWVNRPEIESEPHGPYSTTVTTRESPAHTGEARLETTTVSGADFTETTVVEREFLTTAGYFPTLVRVTSTGPNGETQQRVHAYHYAADWATRLDELVVEPEAEGGVAALETVTTLVYGSSGAGILPTRAQTETAQTPSGVQAPPRAIITIWDPVGPVPLRIEHEGVGVQEVSSHHPALGAFALRDGWGVERHRELDVFGRLRATYTVGRDGTVLDDRVELAYQRVSPGFVTPTTMRVVRSHAAGSVDIVEHDILGRPIYEERDNVQGRVYTTQSFDPHGRLQARAAPAPLGGAATAVTTYAYDALDRRLLTTLDPARQIAASYDGLTAVLTDPEGKQTTIHLDPMGRRRRVIDADGNEICYDHGPFGAPRLVRKGGCEVAAQDSVVGIETDPYGRVTTLVEPGGSGWNTREYSGFGDLVLATNGEGEVVTYQHDSGGRVVSRTDAHGVDTWTYEPLAAEPTRPPGALATSTSADGYIRYYSYDHFGRAYQSSITVDDETFTTRREWDDHGRLLRLHYPTQPGAGLKLGTAPLTVRYGYDSRNNLRTIWQEDDGTSSVRWSLVTANPRGQITERVTGNSVRTFTEYDPVDGSITRIHSGLEATGGYTDIRDLELAYWPAGSLWQRVEELRADNGQVYSMAETYEYDDLHRLVSQEVVRYGGTGSAVFTIGSETKGYGYDAWGNLNSHPELGAIVSTPAGRVQTIAGVATHTYDQAGRLLADGDHAITWRSFNKPATLTGGDGTTTYGYDADGQLIERVAGDGTTVLMIDGLYERTVSPGGSQVHRLPVYAEGRIVAQLEYDGPLPVDDDDGGLGRLGLFLASRATWSYPLADHINSVNYVLDASGAVIQRTFYDPWGNARASSWLLGDGAGGDIDDDLSTGGDPPISLDAPMSSGVNQGFSGHWARTERAFINMKGRLYDPRLGRMASPDPFVASPDSTQTYNRYSYVLNDPATKVDPSGYLVDCLIGCPITMGVVSWIGSFFGSAAVVVMMAPPVPYEGPVVDGVNPAEEESRPMVQRTDDTNRRGLDFDHPQGPCQGVCSPEQQRELNSLEREAALLEENHRLQAENDRLQAKLDKPEPGFIGGRIQNTKRWGTMILDEPLVYGQAYVGLYIIGGLVGQLTEFLDYAGGAPGKDLPFEFTDQMWAMHQRAKRGQAQARAREVRRRAEEQYHKDILNCAPNFGCPGDLAWETAYKQMGETFVDYYRAWDAHREEVYKSRFECAATPGGCWIPAPPSRTYLELYEIHTGIDVDPNFTTVEFIPAPE